MKMIGYMWIALGAIGLVLPEYTHGGVDCFLVVIAGLLMLILGEIRGLSEKKYKIKEKKLEEAIIVKIFKHLNWRGAHMLFPFVEDYKDKRGVEYRVRGNARVDLKITFMKRD